jgi:hypothetical protein
MPAQTLSDRILSTGLARQSRPGSAPPLPVSVQAAQSVQPFRVPSPVQTIENGIARVSRPYPFTDLSRQVAADRRVNRAVAEVVARNEALAAQRAEAAAANALRGAALRGRAAAALRPVAAVGARVGAAVLELPVIGKAVTKIAPFAKGPGPFFALTALQLIPSVMEYFAPGVRGWLMGGWKGRGEGKVNPNAGRYLLGGTASDVYKIEMWGNDGAGDQRLYNIYSQPGLTAAYLTAKGNYWFINFASINTNQEIQSVNTFRYESYWRNTYLRFYKNNQPVPQESNLIRPDIVTQNPKKVPPGQTPTDNAQNARDAALAAAALTAAAGTLKLAPPSLPNPGKGQQRKVGKAAAPSGQPDPAPTKTPFPSPDACKGNACGTANLDASKANTEKLDELLKYLQALGIGDIRTTVNRIDEKVGPQLYDQRGNKTGLAGAAIQTFQKLSKVGEYLHFDRVMNVLTFAATTHNAVMLSRDLGQTLGSALGNALAAIGIKDTEGNALDIGNIVGHSVESAIKAAIGAENYASLSATWKKANRIYQAAANLGNNIQSLRYSITGALETIGGWNARIGNALKKYGVLGDNAYPWMNPSPNFDNRFMRGLETVENAVSQIDSVASEVLSAQETVAEIGKQKTELAAAIKNGTEKPGVDNVQQKATATATKTASKSPDLVGDNFVKPEG